MDRFCGEEVRADYSKGLGDIGSTSSVLSITLGFLAVFLGVAAVVACVFAVCQRRRNAAYVT